MEPFRHLLAHPALLFWPAVTLIAAILVGLVARKLLFRVLRAWTDRTQSRPGLILSDALRGSTVIWIVIAAVHLAIETSELPARWTAYESKTLSVLWILSLTV